MTAYLVIRNAQPRDVLIRLSDLLRCFDRMWIETISPQEFSVHGNLGALTNCALTAVKIIENRLKGNTEIWNFTRSLCRIQTRSYADLERVNERRAISVTPRVRYVINTTKLRRAWRLLEAGTINNERFLRLASGFLQPFVESLMFQNEPRVANFQPIHGAHGYVYVDAVNVPAEVGEIRGAEIGENQEADVGGNRGADIGENQKAEVGENRGAVIGENQEAEVGENRGAEIGENQEAEVGENRGDVEQNVGNQIALEPESPFSLICVICKSNLIQYGCKSCMHITF